ncbi:14720_t:CDS:2 [Dentiscutata erythropus]|uniref:14720_t:CDS:1 n=1 Tax=Dentiscutata erythropus TaxID=1348616 RepID=A0A9N9J238_9GLOM|nr:14720_t:CDS:2 [Dentiscutata erythropus]
MQNSESDYHIATLVKDMGSWFDVYRHNLHVAISTLAEKNHQLVSIRIYKRSNLEKSTQAAFASYRFAILDNDPEIIMKLGTFVCQVVINVLIVQNNQQNTRTAIRKCDEITLDLKILTKFGIVKTLPVRTLLTFFHK